MLDRRQCLGILGLSPSSTQQEIKQAYHDLVKVWHPDRFAHDPALGAKAENKLKEINEAYETLMRLGEEPASGTGRHRRPPPQEPVVRRTREEQPFWDRPVVAFFFLLLFSALLFKISYFVFRGAFHSATPGKTVRDIV
jgi:hypothetical protein